MSGSGTQYEEREKRLPRWAQEKLAALRQKAEWLEKELATTNQAHDVLLNRRWFVLNGPTGEMPDPYHLWMLYPDRAQCVCSLFRGDVLLIGRGENG